MTENIANTEDSANKNLLRQQQEEQIAQQIAQDGSAAYEEGHVTVSQQQHTSYTSRKTPEEMAKQQEVDSRSVYVRNVEFHASPDELEEFFKPIGVVNRVTILFDRVTGNPKGYAYVEFQDQSSVLKAVDELSGQDFKGRPLSVMQKRTNLPGFSRRGTGFRGGRGRFRGGRGRSRGGHSSHTHENSNSAPVHAGEGDALINGVADLGL